jgi:hypothetical protein
MGEEPQAVIVTSPSGDKIRVVPEEASPGLWQISIPAEEKGVYTAELENDASIVSYTDLGEENPKEYENTVNETGGNLSRFNASAENINTPDIVAKSSGEALSGNDWMGVKMTDSSVLKGLERQRLLPPWAALILVVGLLASAWLREGDISTKNLFKKKGNSPQP